MSEYQWTAILRRMVCAIIAIAVIVSAGPPPSQGAEQPNPEEYIFDVLMPPWRIVDGIFAYQWQSRYYVPVIALARGLEFYIEPDRERGYVSGWFVDEDNTFVIDSERKEVIVKGERRELPDYAFLDNEFTFDDDIYIQLEVLNEIWPLTFNVDLTFLTLYAESEQDLAFMKRRERRKRQERLEARREFADQEEKDLPYVENGYRWIGKPVVDVQATHTYDNKEKELTGNYNLSGGQQLFKTFADYSINYRLNEQGELVRPRNARLKFTRKAYDDDSVFGLGLKRVEAGDINIQQRDLIGNSTGGRGVTFSNSTRERDVQFDTVTVEGEGPVGWEIEVYNNNQLILFGEVADNGEYRFDDVPLRFGENEIRVVLYGPQGQVREEVERYKIGGNMLKPGEFEINGGLVDSGRPLILFENKPRTSARGIAASTQMSYGVNKNLTLFATASKMPISAEEKKYATAGASFSALGVLGQLELYKEFGGGKVFDTRFSTELFGVRLNARNSIFKDFESIDAGFDQNRLDFEGEYEANTNIRTSFGTLGLNLNALHQEFKNGNVATVISTQQSLTRGGIRISNNTSTQVNNELHQRTSGSIDATVRFGNWQMRGNTSYSLHPTSELTNARAELRYKTDDAFQAAIRGQHNFLESISGGSIQLGYDFGPVLNTIDAEYIQERGWEFVLRASTSLHPYTEDGGYALSSENKRTVSPVRGNVFLDRNADGAFNEGDEPLEGVRLAIDGGRSREETNADGTVITFLNADTGNVNLSLTERSLIDPYFKPGNEGYRTLPLPGTMPVFDFPVIETGSIDGTVYYEDGSPIPGMTLELVNSEGKVVDTSETAYDGFYTYEFVPPGTYTIRPDPSYEVNIPPETVTVASDDLFAFGIDLHLLEQAEEARAAEESADGDSSGVAQTHYAPAAPGMGQPAPLSNDGGSSVIVNRVRIGEHSDKVRLVLDLSGSIAYTFQEVDEGQEIYLDMPGAAWDALKNWRGDKTPVLKSFEAQSLPDGGVRLILKARATMDIGDHALLPPSGDKGHRLFIDLVKSE